MKLKLGSPVSGLRLARRLAKRWSSGAPGTARIRVERVEQRGKRKTLMAVISSSGTRSDFYNPMEAVAKMLSDELDPTRQPQPVRVLNPASVCSTAIVDARRARWAHKKTQYDRMAKIAGYFLNTWPAGPRLEGFFYLYGDKVLYQSFDAEGGWTNFRVPEEGVDWKNYEKGARSRSPEG